MNWLRRSTPPRVGLCAGCRQPCSTLETLDGTRYLHRRCAEQIMATVARESRPGWRAAC
jgi:hypothetical protein